MNLTPPRHAKYSASAVSASVPHLPGQFSPDGKKIAYNRVALGYDAQLMKAVEVLLEKIEADPQTWPQHGPYPRDKQVEKK